MSYLFNDADGTLIPEDSVGRHIFAYHPDEDMVLIILHKNEMGAFSGRHNLDLLEDLGFKYALHFDGSDSAILYEYNAGANGRWIFNDIGILKNRIFIYGYAIKKTT